MDERGFYVGLSLDLIQELRLAHALAETGYLLHVRPGEAQKLAQLTRIFGLRFKAGDEDVPVLHGLSVDHLKPETKVGSIARPLIFPFAAFDYCRARWPDARPVRASFPGAPTASRRDAINDWLALSGLKLRIPEHIGERARAGRLKRAWQRLGRRLGVPRRDYLFAEGVKITFSNEGRMFPHKTWNVGYYAGLLESEFVLCPDGDFGKDGIAWTYRFFESILCGAIPVIQNAAPIYEGFEFARMDRPLSELKWSQDTAEHNFRLARERLTVPADELRLEIERLLANGTASQPPLPSKSPVIA